MLLTETSISRETFDGRQSLLDGRNYAGIEYDHALISADGVLCTLYVHADHTSDQIKEAKRIGCQTHDIVRFSLVLVPREWYVDHVADESQEESGAWVDSFRRILADGQSYRVDTSGALVPSSLRGGQLVNTWTAQTCLNVYAALNAENRAKLRAMPVYVAVNVCVEIASRNS